MRGYKIRRPPVFPLLLFLSLSLFPTLSLSLSSPSHWNTPHVFPLSLLHVHTRTRLLSLRLAEAIHFSPLYQSQQHSLLPLPRIEANGVTVCVEVAAAAPAAAAAAAATLVKEKEREETDTLRSCGL